MMPDGEVVPFMMSARGDHYWILVVPRVGNVFQNLPRLNEVGCGLLSNPRGVLYRIERDNLFCSCMGTEIFPTPESWVQEIVQDYLRRTAPRKKRSVRLESYDEKD